MHRMRQTWIHGLLFAMLFILPGCTGAELAIVGAASAGLSTGQEITRTGKLRLALMQTGPQLVDAAESACDELGLKIYERKQVDDYKCVLRVSDRKHTLRITVLELAPNLAEVEINVGFFGSGAEAELILKRIVAKLRDDGELDEPEA